ncbi:hypothetical protein SAMN04244550_00146 [Rhodobacter capsulatus]|uniref:Uncharacterized protein n=2 Tax=Rhodobacter capsulatus TaxID=1061 RepID=A0A1G7C4V8_RHOCA|nr:hypothetical protein SAMN04244550_00146 [Rhodobacter capsulatus]
MRTRSPSIREREKVFATTLALWAIDPETGQSDWPFEEFIASNGLPAKDVTTAIDRLARAGWINQHRGEDGGMVLRLTWPTFNEWHPDFEPNNRLAAITISAAMEDLTALDGVPEEFVLAGALTAVACAIAARHGPAEAARRLRDLALFWDDPEAWANAPAGPSGG